MGSSVGIRIDITALANLIIIQNQTFILVVGINFAEINLLDPWFGKWLHSLLEINLENILLLFFDVGIDLLLVALV